MNDICKECGTALDKDNDEIICQMCGLKGCEACIASILCDMCMDDLAWSRRETKFTDED